MAGKPGIDLRQIKDSKADPTDAEDAGTGIAADMNARQLRINSGGAGR
jgi:hypothetical protein